jgi:hypothetical protein
MIVQKVEGGIKMATLNKKLSLVIVLTVVLFVFSESILAEGEVFRLYGGSTDWGFNHAGYSDSFNWSNSNHHPYGYHEMLGINRGRLPIFLE